VRLLLYEHVTAGGLGDCPAPSLCREGAAMLRALAEDFAAVAGIEVIVHVAPWFHETLAAKVVRAPAVAFSEGLQNADAVLAIAPEFDGILERLCVETKTAGRQWLGCTADAIRLTADKRALGEWWLSRNMPTPPFVDVPTRRSVVVKPRFGAGSQDTQRYDEWTPHRLRAASETFVVQEFADGLPASIAFLCGPNDRMPMRPTAQRLSADGAFQYLGGRVPLPSDLETRAIALGRRAISGIKGLQGWVGVDLVLGESAKDDRAIEINPRLTTSYVGMRRVARTNLASAWLDVSRGVSPAIAWRDEVIEFDAQ
jgi:predicted ATP-grasp superfamily ATP-dependent carboligase